MAIDPFFGSVLSAGANILGGLLGRSSARDANANAANAMAMNVAQQKNFAQNAIRWRANDAMLAHQETGIHPLALLGVQGPTYTPVTTAFTGDGFGESIARAGQDISRGIHATADRELRAAAVAVQEKQLALTTERMGLENELLRTQIASSRARLSQAANPPMPSVNQQWLIPGVVADGVSGPLIKEEPMKRTRVDMNAPFYEPGAVPGVGHLRMPDGTLMPVKSKDAQERLEDDWFGNFKHFLIRTLGPMFGDAVAPHKVRGGHRWVVDWKGDWYERPLGPNDLWKRGRHPSQR